MHQPDPDLHLRPETAEDGDFLAQLHASTRDDLRQIGLPDEMLGKLLAGQFHAQQSGYRQQYPDADFLVIEKGGAAIGQMIVHRDTSIRLVYLALLPQDRGHGYGHGLLQALQAEAAAAGKALRLSVSTQNTEAQRLYAALGWAVSSNDGAYLAMVWPTKLAAVAG